MTKQY